MKGVVLAGGLGTRLRPLTSVTNKHLLPVYNQPMIYYPIQTLVNAGITDIMVVTGGSSAGEFLRLLGNGKAFGLKHLNYAYQEGEGGIADALSLVEHFAADGPMCVVLGDNIIEGNIRYAVEAYRRQGKGAKIILKKVPDPQRFGVPRLEGSRVDHRAYWSSMLSAGCSRTRSTSRPSTGTSTTCVTICTMMRTSFAV